MMGKRQSGIFALVAVMVFAFAACTTKNKEAAPDQRVLHLSQIQKLKGMDPAFTSDLYSSTEVNRVYEGLFQYHYLKRPYELEPLLAAAMPEVSKDNLTFKIKIRRGVFFHDDPAFPEGKGREVEAKDFVFSLMRLADPKVQSTGWWTLEDRIVGLDEWRAEALKSGTSDYAKEIAGLKALDAETLEIKLRKPYPQLLNVLAMPYGAVVAREAVEKYGPEFINKAVGTGPFLLEEFRPSEMVSYVRNPKYREVTYPTEGEAGDDTRGLLADAGKKLPLVDRIEVRVIVESQPRWMHFLKGELDIISVPKDNFKDALTPDVKLSEEFTNKGVKLIRVPGMDFTYTAFNLESEVVPQFNDKRIRRAISLALASDINRLIEIFFNGLGVSAQTPVPPGISGYMKEYQNPYKRTDALAEAKRLLEEAGYKDGKGMPEIPFDIVASTNSRQIAEAEAQSLAKIGLKVKILPNTWPEFQSRIQRRQAHFWSIAWSADYPDAENFLQLFYGPNAQPGGMNAAYYKNPKYDALFNQARVMQDSPARTKIYNQLAKMVAEDVPVVLGIHRENVGLTQPWLGNYKYSEFPLNEAKYLNVDLVEKATRLKK